MPSLGPGAFVSLWLNAKIKFSPLSNGICKVKNGEKYNFPHTSKLFGHNYGYCNIGYYVQLKSCLYYSKSYQSYR